MAYKRVNLTKINGCYSKELREGCNDIKILVKDKLTTVDTLKQFVNNIIEPAKIEAEAKHRFKEHLQACKTKDEVDELCRMAVLHGMYYVVHLKEE